MSHSKVLLLLVALAAALAAQATAAPVGSFAGPQCGGTRWRLMTLSDATRSKVAMAPKPTTIGDLAKLVGPKRFSTSRTSSFDRTNWQLSVVVDRFRMASNGEIVLILFDRNTGAYMNAYLPAAPCLPSTTRGRAGILAARAAFGKCGAAGADWTPLGASVELTGVGFWNPAKSTRGALPNGAELRPVTSLKIVSGCGVG